MRNGQQIKFQIIKRAENDGISASSWPRYSASSRRYELGSSRSILITFILASLAA